MSGAVAGGAAWRARDDVARVIHTSGPPALLAGAAPGPQRRRLCPRARAPAAGRALCRRRERRAALMATPCACTRCSADRSRALELPSSAPDWIRGGARLASEPYGSDALALAAEATAQSTTVDAACVAVSLFASLIDAPVPVHLVGTPLAARFSKSSAELGDMITVVRVGAAVSEAWRLSDVDRAQASLVKAMACVCRRGAKANAAPGVLLALLRHTVAAGGEEISAELVAAAVSLALDLLARNRDDSAVRLHAFDVLAAALCHAAAGGAAAEALTASEGGTVAQLLARLKDEPGCAHLQRAGLQALAALLRCAPDAVEEAESAGVVAFATEVKRLLPSCASAADAVLAAMPAAAEDEPEAEPACDAKPEETQAPPAPEAAPPAVAPAVDPAPAVTPAIAPDCDAAPEAAPQESLRTALDALEAAGEGAESDRRAAHVCEVVGTSFTETQPGGVDALMPQLRRTVPVLVACLRRAVAAANTPLAAGLIGALQTLLALHAQSEPPTAALTAGLLPALVDAMTGLSRVGKAGQTLMSSGWELLARQLPREPHAFDAPLLERLRHPFVALVFSTACGTAAAATLRCALGVMLRGVDAAGGDDAAASVPAPQPSPALCRDTAWAILMSLETLSQTGSAEAATAETADAAALLLRIMSGVLAADDGAADGLLAAFLPESVADAFRASHPQLNDALADLTASLRRAERDSRARCEAAVAAMAVAPASDDALGAACAFFASAAAKRDVPAIAAAMAASTSHAGLQIYACNALLAVSAGGGGHALLTVEPQLIELLLATLQRHGRANRAVATPGLRALTRAAWPAARTVPLPLATASRVLDLVDIAAFHGSDSEVGHCTLEALVAVMCATSPGMLVAARDAAPSDRRGVPCGVPPRALGRFMANGVLADSDAAAFRTVLASPEFRRLLNRHFNAKPSAPNAERTAVAFTAAHVLLGAGGRGAADVAALEAPNSHTVERTAVGALAAHLTDASLAVLLLQFIIRLAVPDGVTPDTAACKRLVKARAAGYVIGAMNAHLSDAFVLELGWRALLVLLEAEEVDPEALAAFGVQQLAVATLSAHMRAGETVIACCAALCMLLDWAHDHETLDFGADGVIEALSRGMQAVSKAAHRDVEPAVFSAAAYALSTKPEPNVRLFCAAGGLDAAVAAVMRSPRCGFRVALIAAHAMTSWLAYSLRGPTPWATVRKATAAEVDFGAFFSRSVELALEGREQPCNGKADAAPCVPQSFTRRAGVAAQLLLELHGSSDSVILFKSGTRSGLARAIPDPSDEDAKVQEWLAEQLLKLAVVALGDAEAQQAFGITVAVVRRIAAGFAGVNAVVGHAFEPARLLALADDKAAATARAVAAAEAVAAELLAEEEAVLGKKAAPSKSAEKKAKAAMKKQAAPAASAANGDGDGAAPTMTASAAKRARIKAAKLAEQQAALLEASGAKPAAAASTPLREAASVATQQESPAAPATPPLELETAAVVLSCA